MWRFLLWMLFFYFVWKILKSLITPSKKQTTNAAQSPHQSGPPFHDVEEAKFEDVTPKSPSDPQSSSSK